MNDKSNPAARRGVQPVAGDDDTAAADPRAELASLLQSIQHELEHLGLWEGTPPTARALASPMPFCCDTLRFTQWLQWVFIPRTRALLDAGGRFPFRSAIHPMAEEALDGCAWDARALLGLIGDCDRVINRLPETGSRRS
jgi:uncharacterized protein YqcC (DUF446 family)